MDRSAVPHRAYTDWQTIFQAHVCTCWQFLVSGPDLNVCGKHPEEIHVTARWEHVLLEKATAGIPPIDFIINNSQSLTTETSLYILLTEEDFNAMKYF